MAEMFIRGVRVLIDDPDAEAVARHRWHVSGGRVSGTLRDNLGRRKSTYLHRWLLNAPKGLDVDHANGNPLDNRRCNLRLATRSQNQANTRNFRKNRTGFKGVFWKIHYSGKKPGSWCGCVTLNGRRYEKFGFDTPEQAARWYDQKAREVFGEFAATNFDAAMGAPESSPATQEER